MLLIATSPDAIVIGGKPEPGLVKVLRELKEAGNPVGVMSNNAQPSWFDDVFSGSGVQFLQVRARQDGGIISHNAQLNKLGPQDVIVLAVKPEDVQMGKNGGAVLIGAGWSSDPQVKALGIGVKDANEFREVVKLAVGWPGGWWYAGDEPRYGVRALCDLSSHYKENEQVNFSKRVTNLVKQGGPRLYALLAITCRSLLLEGIASEKDLAFGVFPSSGSKNDDSEVLSDFAHRVRTTVSRVHFAKRGHPLFIRHKASSKRSAGGGGDRTDPSEQIETVHVNPFYRGKLSGRKVIVIDDCTTYGVSFGVAAAFLRRAGAHQVLGIALGKFGHRVRYYEIDISSSPYQPVPAGKYKVTLNRHFTAGTTNSKAQSALLSLIP